MREDIKTLADMSTDLTLSVANADRLLSGSIIKYLIDKGIVDVDDYISHTTEIKEHLLKFRELDDDRDRKILEMTFNQHIIDLKKPD